MSEATASSVSKGVFVYHGKKRSVNRAELVERSAVSDGDSDRVQRMKLCTELWEQVNSRIQSLQSELGSNVFNELLEFVSSAHGARSEYNKLPQFAASEIPAAALVTGVNSPDHSAMFASLRAMVRDRVTRHVVSLRSTTCHTLKSTVVSTVMQLLPGANDLLDADDEEQDSSRCSSAVNKTSCSLMDVVEWYNSVYSTTSKTSSSVGEKEVKSVGGSIGFTSPTKRRSAQPKTPQKSPVKRPSQTSTSSSDASVLSPLRTGLRSSGMTPRKSDDDARNSPAKRRMAFAVDSPQKCPPASPGPSREGLRSSGTTPKKSEPSPDVVSPSSSVSLAKKDLKFVSGTISHCGSAVKANIFGSPSRTEVASAKKGLLGNDEKSSTDQSSCSPPVVIVFEDFEGFDCRILQDFITICGYHLTELPVVLIFGIATTINAVHRLLPHHVTSLLSMEKFQAPMSSDYLSLVLCQILLNHDFPFKLSFRVFDFLLDVFLFHDFSVLGFVRGYEFAMMEHFYSTPLSLLCQCLPPAQRISKLSDKQLGAVRECNSFKCYVEEQSSSEQMKLQTDNKYTKKEICRMLTDLDHYHVCFYPVLSCLHSLTSKLPGSPLGKQLRELYATCLSKNMFESVEYRQAMSLLRTMSRDELVPLLSTSTVPLSTDNNNVPAELTTVSTNINDFISKFQNITDVNFIDESEEVDSVESSSEIIPKKTTMYALRQKLQELDKQKKDRKLTVYEKLRSETIDFLDTTFRQYLRSPKSFPLHEALYYDGVSELKRRLCAAPRAAIQTALSQPYFYLKNEALNVSEEERISADFPDLCIVYKLHLECGRLINLYDWLQAFASIVQSKEETTDDTQTLSHVVQARFIRAVSELQFLGFIKPTKRKTDHVARLTWGPC